MNGTPPPAVAAGKPVLFEVNLIRNRIDSLRRRRRMQNLAMVASLVMLLAGGAMAVFAGLHLLQKTKVSAALKSDRMELTSARALCNDLDEKRKVAKREIAFVTPLITVSRKRIEWSVKLEQFSSAVGPTGGVQMLAGNSGDVYTETDPKTATFRPAEAPQLTYAVLMPASATVRLNSFSQTLNGMTGFASKIGYAQTEAIELDTHDPGAPAVVRGSCKPTGGQP
jgi:hypothetical protein